MSYKDWNFVKFIMGIINCVTHKDWLSYKIKKKLPSISNEKKYSYWWEEYFAVPSIKGNICLGILILVTLIGSTTHRKPQFFFKINYIFTTILSKSSLVEIHAGICLIIFALLVFIIGAAKNNQESDKLRLLLYNSFIYPITITSIYIFIFLLIRPSSLIIGALLIISVAILTIYSVAKTIRLLVDPVFFRKKMQQLIHSRFLAHIKQELYERIGNSILSDEAEGKYIGFSLFSLDEEKYRPIFLKKSGIVVDINLKRLERLNNKLLEEYSNDCKFKAENDPKIVKDNRWVKEKDDCLLYLSPFFYRLNNTEKSDAGAIAWIHNKLQPQIACFEKDLSKVVKINKTKTNFSEQIQTEMENLQNQCIDSINNQHISKVKECARYYVSLIISFSGYMFSVNLDYSSEDAEREIHSLYGGWGAIDWAKKTLKHL